jgi:ABC-type polysaccharide/polyol phosphate export permease
MVLTIARRLYRDKAEMSTRAGCILRFRSQPDRVEFIGVLCHDAGAFLPLKTSPGLMTSVPILARRPLPAVTSAADDLLDGLRQWDLWGRLGWLEIKRRYHRTTIGPFWSAISLGVLVMALGGVGAGLWNQQTRDYLPFLAAGMLVWMFMSTVITESCGLFISSTGLFRQMRFNYSVLAYALVYRNFIVFLHNMLVYVVVFLIYAPGKFGAVTLLAVPGMALVLVNGVWIALLFGMACLRFRDLQQLISTLIQISMFVTPIFWPPESLQGFMHVVYVELNPLYHLITIVRAPLMGQVPPTEVYMAISLITVVGWSVTYACFRYFRRRIAYWS